VPNRVNADIRGMMLQALHCVGGVRYLAKQAVENPGPFLTLLGKVMPTQIASTDGSPIHLHLIAAQLVSAQLTEQMRQPPTIVSTATEQPANLLDAPVPTE
jgi:hypothetical protein